MAEKPILNIDEVEFVEFGNDTGFKARLGSLSRPLGAEKLGYQIVELEPGKAGWPYHLHHMNEEMFFILEGSGTLRYDGQEYPVRAGDVICGHVGPGTARQIRNTSDKPLRYLALSTMETPEVAQYPDSGKFAAICGPRGANRPEQLHFRMVCREDSGVDYWDGEKV